MNMQNAKPDWAMNKREKARAEKIAAGETPKKRRKWPWVVLVLAAIGGGAAWYTQTQVPVPTEVAQPDPAPQGTVVQLAPYEVETIAPMRLEESLRMTGSLAPVQQVHLSSEVSARLIEVNVREGDTVSAGEVIARFDVVSLENQLSQALSNAEATRVQVAQAQSDFTRTETLVSRNLAASTALENARSGLEQLQAQLDAQETAVQNARDALDKATITAPFDGVVSERNADPGEFIGAGSPLFTVVDLSAFEVEATAPVSKSPMIERGQPVQLSVEGFGDQVFTGKVERISPVAITGSRALPVYVSLANQNGALRGGMFASGRILIEEKADALSIPIEALREDAEGPYVLSVEGDTLARTPIEIAREWENGARVEIASGLTEGEMILAAAMPEVRAGQTVKLIGD